MKFKKIKRKNSVSENMRVKKKIILTPSDKISSSQLVDVSKTQSRCSTVNMRAD